MTRRKSPKDVLDQLRADTQPALDDAADSLTELLDKYEHSAQAIRGIQGALKEVQKAQKSVASSVAVLKMEIE